MSTRTDGPDERRRRHAVERERRARERRERDRSRGTARRAPTKAERPAVAAATKRSRREHHDGLVVWAAKSVRAVPAALPGIGAGFAREVGAVAVGMVRPLVRHLPGSDRLPARAKPRTAAAGDGTEPTSPVGRIRARRDRRHATAHDAALRRRVRLGALAVVVVLASVGYVVVPSLQAFRIRHVEVVGASAVSDLDVRRAADPVLEGHTVYDVDTDALTSRVEALPFVRSVQVDRHFPGGLSLRVVEYRPLALGYGSGKFWLLARDGRILEKASLSDWVELPKVRLVSKHLHAGMRLHDEPALELLASMRADSSITFSSVNVGPSQVTGWLDDGTEVRFGRPELLVVKLAAAQRMLDAFERKRTPLRYLDVSVPAKPVVCLLSDVRCSQPRVGAAVDATVDGGTAGAATSAGGTATPSTDTTTTTVSTTPTDPTAAVPPGTATSPTAGGGAQPSGTPTENHDAFDSVVAAERAEASNTRSRTTTG